MKAATQKEQSISKVDLPSLTARIQELQLPEERETTVVVKSKKQPEGKQNVQNENIPFECALTLTDGPQEQFESLGLQKPPHRHVSARLSIEDGTLKMELRSKYLDQERYEEIEEYNPHYVSTGQSYPYGPVEPGHMEWDTRPVTKTRKVERSENHENQMVSGQRFNVLYLAILNSDESIERKDLLTFLHESFPDECRKTHEWISACYRKEAEAAAEYARQQTEKFNSLHLPAI